MSDIQIHARTRVEGDERRSAWRTYLDAFEPLRTIAIQRSVMTPGEFDECMADGRVTKYLALDAAGEVVGLGTMTRHIEAMTLVSPEFFAARWPEHWAAKRCYYIGMVGTRTDQQGTDVFTDLIQLMSSTAARTGGVAVLDVCGRNADVHHLPEAIERICSAVVPGLELELVDTESYWAYSSPVPAQPMPSVIDLRDGVVQLPAAAGTGPDVRALEAAVSAGPGAGRPNSQP